MMIKTRFAPSPTGYLHIGGLRTAIFAYLYAKKHNGTFLLRIEDTDRERFVDGAIENIFDALEWAGITPDEGVIYENGVITSKGSCGPYIQSQRMEKGIYFQYATQLINEGLAYYAFDTPEELDLMREKQVEQKLPPRYERNKMTNSLTLSPDEVTQRIQRGDSYVIRMKVPEGITTFTDLIRGEITFNNAEVDDQILMKSDGYPTYHFAVVVDDHDMNITHVIRGEEWIPSTPKHVLLYQMFGWEVPNFAHLPLLVNEEKKKLSKRFGDVSVKDFQKAGYLPDALINFIAFLGWNPGTEKEIYTMEELISDFSIDQVSKSGAVFNREKLNWYNGQYIKKMDSTQIKEFVLPEIHKLLESKQVKIAEEDIYILRTIDIVKERATTINALAVSMLPILQRNEDLEYEAELLIWKKSTKEAAKDELVVLHKLISQINESEWNIEHLQGSIMGYISDAEKGNGDVLWPLRVSLSGAQFSPGPFELLYALGKQESLQRIMNAINKL